MRLMVESSRTGSGSWMYRIAYPDGEYIASGGWYKSEPDAFAAGAKALIVESKRLRTTLGEEALKAQ